jgi:hypothetical protein
MKVAKVILNSYGSAKEKVLEFKVPKDTEERQGNKITIETDNKMVKIVAFCRVYDRKRNGKLERYHNPEWETLGLIPKQEIRYIVCE